jgi:hypothetical protein
MKPSGSREEFYQCILADLRPGQAYQRTPQRDRATRQRLYNQSRMRKFEVGLTVMILFACLAGCGSGQPLRVTTIQLGRSLNPDNTVASFTTVFAPTDTIYLSAVTTGVGSGTLGVRWTYNTKIIGEPEKQVSSRTDAATEFHLQSPGGFPPGDYTAEVFLNGHSAGTRTFRVEQQH